MVQSYRFSNVLLRDGLGIFAGAEPGSRLSQANLDPFCGRVRASKHLLCGPLRLLERRHGLAEIVERGGGVLARFLSSDAPKRRSVANSASFTAEASSS